MAQDAELNIKSGNIKQATTALDRLVEQFQKLAGVTPKVDKGLDKNKKKVKGHEKEVKKSTFTMKRFQKSLQDSTKQVQLIDGPLGGVASRMSALNGILTAGNLLWAGLALSVGLAARAIVQGVAIAADTEVAMESFEAQIKATGYAAGQTALELDTLSRSMAMSTLDSTEDMRKLVGVMLTFKNIGREAFGESTKLAQDMGKALQQDPVTAARTLGKVLNNPLKNFKSLSRAGIDFSKEQQKMIRDAQLNNDIYSAQKIIIEDLTNRFGGYAASQAEATLAGRVDTLGQEWEELKETVGKGLIPALSTATTKTTDLVKLFHIFAESDESKVFKRIAKDLDFAGANSENAASKIAALDKRIAEASKSTGLLGDAWNFITKLPGLDIFLETKDETIEGMVNARKELVKIQKVIEAPKTDIINEELLAYTQAAVEKIALEQRTTDAFLKFGNIRLEGYRREKAAVEALKIAQKLGIEGDEEELAKIAELIFKQSELTEARIQHNTIMQIQKSIQGKTAISEKEIELNTLIGSGVLKNSEQYLQLSAAIDLKNQITRAGLDPNSAEVEGLRAQSEALVELQVQLQATQDLKALGIEFELDNEGRAQAITDEHALTIERNQEIDALDALRKAGHIENEQIYRDKLWKINREFDEKDVKAKKTSVDGIKKLEAMQVADNIAGGISAIAGMAKNSKKAAKIQKAAAIFTASQSLVKSLSEAASLPYPTNIAAGLQAAITGASIVTQARSLAEPSFAFGGVDIEGSGTGRSDSINARIASGESVMTQAATARHKGTLERMNAGLPVTQSGGNVSVAGANIVIQGDASESTAQLIAEKLEEHESRMYQIAQGAAMETIQEENEIGGLLDPI